LALLDSLEAVKGFERQPFTAVHASGKQVVSIRMNPAKANINDLSYPGHSKVSWSRQGYYLDQRPSFTIDPLFHAGAYYVQEASSMFIEEALRQCCDLSASLKVLDLCAAPGGKSTLVQSLLSAESLLVSNEVIKTRVTILAENICKWGAANVVVTNNDPKDFQRLPEYFDVIVVDAPCSGSGLFRKDPVAVDEWSLDNVALCSQRQQRILADILPSLKPGGLLLYATCSYSENEDEYICDQLLAEKQHGLNSIRLALQDDWGIVETLSKVHNAYGYRFFPDKLPGEGFFLSAFRKDSGAEGYEHSQQSSIKNKALLLTKAEEEVVRPYVSAETSLSFFKWKDEILAIPANLLSELLLLQSVLYIKKAGVTIGKLIRQELLPDHELALATIQANNLPSIDLDLDMALQYLRRADVQINSILKGWVLVKYKHLSLGWIKILPGRINNYYPKDWRILNK
jgi:16S rRNA C967 or C1407 C5-methylase (RsmB/RsmF family)/NOL1/NOP2/fmu family ribosome biogenesis protein